VVLDIDDTVDVVHGHQPMCSADGRYALTYNGEIYNYLELRQTLAAALIRDGALAVSVVAHLEQHAGMRAVHGQSSRCACAQRSHHYDRQPQLQRAYGNE